MSRPPPPPSRPSPGLAAAWLLGLAALLGSLTATVRRVMEVHDPPSPLDGSIVLASPEGSDPVRRADARRVDTIPGLLSVSHAVEIASGWVVLDSRARRVYVIPEPPGPPVGFGGEGDGPGEMRLPYRVAVSEGLVGVLEGRGDRLVRFALDGTVVGPVRLTGKDCAFGPAKALLGAPGGGFLILRSCTELDGGTRATLVRVGAGGSVEEIADRPLPSLRSRAVDPWASPVAAVVGGSAWLGTLSAGCLAPVATPPGVRPPPPLCAPTEDRVALPDSTRDRLVELAERVELLGGSLRIPERLPSFTGVRSTGAGLILEVPLPDGRTALDLVREGGARTRFVPESPRSTFVGRRHFLLVRDLVEGTEIAWVARND